MQEYRVAVNMPVVSSPPEIQSVFWNPSSTKSVFLTHFSLHKWGGAGPSCGIVRVSTEGTPTSTVTPGQDNSFSGDAAPPSAVRVAVADFTAAPTEQGPELRFRPGDLPGSMIEFELDMFEVPPGTGLAFKHMGGTTQIMAAVYGWKE